MLQMGSIRPISKQTTICKLRINLTNQLLSCYYSIMLTPETHHVLGQELDPKHTDPMTGFANRKWLSDNLSGILEQNPGECGILFIDNDGLKTVNDTEGHAAGDELIIKTTEVISQSIRSEHHSGSDKDRPGDMVGRLVRLGGDEYVAVLVGVATPEDIKKVADRIRNNLSEQNIGVSIGGALHAKENAVSPTELMRQADKAMYLDKAYGKAVAFNKLPRRKQMYVKIGEALLRRAGVNPPRQ